MNRLIPTASSVRKSEPLKPLTVALLLAAVIVPVRGVALGTKAIGSVVCSKTTSLVPVKPPPTSVAFRNNLGDPEIVGATWSANNVVAL